MIPNALSSGNKVIASLLFCCCLALNASAQKAPRKPPGIMSFLDTQWWLGIRMGTVMTHPTVSQRRYAFSPLNYEQSENNKSYESWGNPGLMAGLDVIFYHKGFSIGLQPVYKQLNYGYRQVQAWNLEDGATALLADLQVEQKLHYLELPIMIKYDILKSGNVRPFVQVGWQQSFLLDAQKDAVVRHEDFASDPAQSYVAGDFRIGNKESFDHFHGVLGGLGVNLDYSNIRTIIEANYHMPLQSVNARANPFQENELVSLGDVPDELTIQQINISVSFVFPLRYIDKTFSPF